MGQPKREVMGLDKITEADRAIINQLEKGARTKGYLVENTAFHRNTIGQRLDVLQAADIVECIHEPTALYELRSNPLDE